MSFLLPRVAVLIVTDGRAEYLSRMLDSLKLGPNVAYGPVVIVDDSADPTHWAAVATLLTGFNGKTAPVHLRHLHRRGLAGAIQSGWDLLGATEADYVLHLEDDFVFTEPVPVAEMVDVLRIEPRLANVVLKRQPWNPEEMAMGGIIECHPDEYEDRAEYHDGRVWSWVEHSRCFSLNPCVYPKAVMAYGWPDTNEAGMTAKLVANGHRFAFYGARDDLPRAIHIGAKRSSAWAL